LAKATSGFTRKSSLLRRLVVSTLRVQSLL
jgi:hypothetical protein